MKAREARIEAVVGAIGNAAGDHTAVATDVGDRDQNSSTADTTASTSTVTASWLGRDLDDPDTDADESTMPSLSITVTTATGTDLTFRTEAVEADPDATPAVEAAPKTATELSRGLDDFMHGYQIEDGGTHAIVFTDKMQGADEVAEVTAITARYVEDEPAVAAQLTLGADRTGRPSPASLGHRRARLRSWAP